MRLLIVSGTCSAEKYKEIYEKRTCPMLDTNQKFFLSLIEGLSEFDGVYVDCVTSLPISHSCYSETIVKSEEETNGGVSYHYCGCINYPVIRTLTVGYSIKAYVKKYIKMHINETIIVLSDGLLGEANALVPMLKKRKIPCVALVTDVPNIVSDMNRSGGMRSLMSKVYGEKTSQMLRSYDGYIFLTEQMDDVCNPKRKPYMIMECIVTPLDITKIPKEKLSQKPIVLYAGKLHSDFGVLQLAKAAKHLKNVCEIWLYGGHGDCDAELQRLADENNNLKIHGIVPLDEIHKIERNCDILVNPRSNDKEFTKYSFPSKTAEYLMMDVPVVMYKLDGIPDEYDKYLYYISENTEKGIADKIHEVLSAEPLRRSAVSADGREYVINNKNNINQARRVIEFIKDIKSED